MENIEIWNPYRNEEVGNPPDKFVRLYIYYDSTTGLYFYRSIIVYKNIEARNGSVVEIHKLNLIGHQHPMGSLVILS